MGAIDIVKRLFRLKSPPLSTLAVAAKLLPRKKFEQIFVSTPDRRLVIKAVADALKQSEEEVLATIARKMGLEFTARLVPLDPTFLPDGLTLNDLKKAGCTLVTLQDALAGIVCIDPAMVRAALIDSGRIEQSLPLSLAPWATISAALEESERMNIRIAEQRAIEQRIGYEKLLSSLFALLVSEVESHGEEACTIKITEAEITYSFVTNSGRKARGTINPSARQALRALESLGSFPVKRGSGESLEHFSTKVINDEILLTWRVPAVEEPKPHKLTVIPGTRESAPEQSDASIVQSGEAPVNADAPLILVVDDNITFTKVLDKFLRRHQMRTYRVSNGQEALEWLKDSKNRPDTIVCDVHMPTMNGFDFLATLRADSHLASIPIVMLTSDGEVETELKLLSGGADAYVNKGEDPRVLAVHIQRLLKKRHAA